MVSDRSKKIFAGFATTLTLLTGSGRPAHSAIDKNAPILSEQDVQSRAESIVNDFVTEVFNEVFMDVFEKVIKEAYPAAKNLMGDDWSNQLLNGVGDEEAGAIACLFGASSSQFLEDNSELANRLLAAVIKDGRLNGNNSNDLSERLKKVIKEGYPPFVEEEIRELVSYDSVKGSIAAFITIKTKDPHAYEKGSGHTSRIEDEREKSQGQSPPVRK